MINNDVIVSVVHLTKKIKTSTGSLILLNDINFKLNRGASLALLGVSGSGKTTLLGQIAGLDIPSTGYVQIAGQKLTELNEDGRALLRAQMIGFVFQNFQLLQELTALENISLPLELTANPHAAQLAKEILSQVGLQSRGHHYPRQLSGGEQQRCAIARAFACQPGLLIADEPTGNLDQKTGRKIIDLLFELNQEHNTTLIIATHDEPLAARCNRRLQLEDGQLISDE